MNTRKAYGLSPYSESVRTQTAYFVSYTSSLRPKVDTIPSYSVRTRGFIRGSIPLSSTIKRLVRRGSGKANGQKPKMYGHADRIDGPDKGSGKLPALLDCCVLGAYSWRMTTSDSATTRRTKRRYAHELYPHGSEFETRLLEVEVPYLYARAIGFDVRGTGWFDAEHPECGDRTHHMIDTQQTALMADAMLQGLTGQAAWEWADRRMTDDGEFVYERAVHYGVDPDQIKPYPCGPTPKHHEHGTPSGNGWSTITRVPGIEDDCEECTEPVATTEATK